MSEPTTTRRGFSGWTAATLGAIPLVGGLFAGLRAGIEPQKNRIPKTLPLGKVDQVPDEGLKSKTVSYRRRIGGRVETVTQTVLLGRDENGVYGLSNRCTHLGCAVSVARGEDAKGALHCPCHDGWFDASGAVVDGPPDRPLPRVDLRISADGQIEWVLG